MFVWRFHAALIAVLLLDGCFLWLPAPPPETQASEGKLSAHSVGYPGLGPVRIYGSRTHLMGADQGRKCAIGYLEKMPALPIAGAQFSFHVSSDWSASNEQADGSRYDRLVEAMQSIPGLLGELGFPETKAVMNNYLLPPGCSHDSLVLTFYAVNPTHCPVFSGDSIAQVSSTIVHELAHIAIQGKYAEQLPNFVD